MFEMSHMVVIMTQYERLTTTFFIVGLQKRSVSALPLQVSSLWRYLGVHTIRL